MRSLLGFGGIAILAGLACSSNEPGSAGGYGCSSTEPNAVVKTIDPPNAHYSPDTTNISLTQKVCWENDGAVLHSVHFDLPDTTDVNLSPMSIYSRGFGVAGDYPFHCDYHSTMKGVIRVR